MITDEPPDCLLKVNRTVGVTGECIVGRTGVYATCLFPDLLGRMWATRGVCLHTSRKRPSSSFSPVGSKKLGLTCGRRGLFDTQCVSG